MIKQTTHVAADLRTKILEFRGCGSSLILIVKGLNSQANRGFLRKFESAILEILSMETGRTWGLSGFECMRAEVFGRAV